MTQIIGYARASCLWSRQRGDMARSESRLFGRCQNLAIGGPQAQQYQQVLLCSLQRGGGTDGAASVTFAHGWRNPAHDQLIRWLAGHPGLSKNRRRQLAMALRRLRKSREDADYRPGVSLSRADAVKLLKDAALIVHALETRNEREGQG